MASPKHRYFVIYKPYGMLSQFSDEGAGRPVLGSLYDFPADVYPVGRLDADSEGLLLLTNDKSLNSRLLNPKSGHQREYYAQVEGIPQANHLQVLASGVEIRANKRLYKTRPAVAKLLTAAPPLPDRNPPVRYRKTVPDSWLSLTLTEGKNRQVRKMTAATGFPTLRLVRVRIAGLHLGNMQSGEVKEADYKRIYTALFGK